MFLKTMVVFVMGLSVAASDSIISRVRSQIQQWHRQNPKLFHQDEVDFVNKDDKLIQMAAEVKRDFNGTSQLMYDILRWRSANRVSRISPSEFPAELFHTGNVAIVGQDKQKEPVFWFVAKNNVPDANVANLTQRVTIYFHERMLRDSPSGRFLMVADLGGAKWENFDRDRFNFILQTLNHYYPSQIKNVLTINVQTLIKPAVTVLKSMSDNADKILDIESSQLTKYMNKKQIPKYVGGSNPVDFSTAPSGALSYKQKLPNYLAKKDFERFLKESKGSWKVE